MKIDSIVDVDHLVVGIESYLCGIGFLVVGLLHDHPQGANPGDLITNSIFYEKGVHLEEIVADEVEWEVLFSVDREAEELARGKLDAVVRVPT